MYYICSKTIKGKNVIYGVKDTKDGVVEYYSYQDVIKFHQDLGLTIKGISQDSNGKWVIRVYKPTQTIKLNSSFSKEEEKKENIKLNIRQKPKDEEVKLNISQKPKEKKKFKQNTNQITTGVVNKNGKIIDYSWFQKLYEDVLSIFNEKYVRDLHGSDAIIIMHEKDKVVYPEKSMTFNQLINNFDSTDNISEDTVFEYVIEMKGCRLLIGFSPSDDKYYLKIEGETAIKVFSEAGFPEISLKTIRDSSINDDLDVVGGFIRRAGFNKD